MRVIYYYQTFVGLSALLNNPQYVDVINLSAIHFGKDYIHLNNSDPNSEVFDTLWSEIDQANKLGVKIHLMIGGAAGAYQVLFSDFEKYYKMLYTTLIQHPAVTGVDLDVEEATSLTDMVTLIKRIRADFGPSFTITMTPNSGALQRDEPSIGGFIYKELYNSEIGAEIAWFNVQAYDDYTFDSYKLMVDNGYPADKLVFGMLSDQFRDTTFRATVDELEKIHVVYPDMGGVYDWEYFDAPPGPNPLYWAEIVTMLLKWKKLLRNFLVST
jgi:hypothetical protein